MNEARVSRAFISGVTFAAIATLVVVGIRVLSWLIDDPRWWLAILLVGAAGGLGQWIYDRDE